MVSIFGCPASGKSTLMNHLGGTSSFRRQCDTKGVDIDVVKLESKPVIFADSEGHNEGRLEYDTNLFTPLMLVSGVCLFNWKGGFKKNDILNMMSIVIDAT